jgi:flavin-dependent dehydrogenase
MRIAVVGGGPVGLYAAGTAARSGLDVTLIEKRTGKPDKACGEGLMPTAVAALAELGVDAEGFDFHGIRYLSASGERQAHAALVDGSGRGVRRTALVAALQTRADQLGVRRVTHRVIDHSQQGELVHLECDDGTAFEVNLVLATDGLSSDLRRQARLEVPVEVPARYGLRRHFAVQPWSDDVEVYWADQGEAYVTPVAHDMVGVALLGPRGGAFESRLQHFPALRERLRQAASVGPVLGAGPLRRKAARPLHGRVLLVGDAAGYVDALTGEGLAIGFLSAQAAVAATVTGDLEQYAAEWRRITRRFRWSTELLLRATTAQAPRSVLLPLAASWPSLFGRAVRVMT